MQWRYYFLKKNEIFNKHQKSHENENICYICKEKLGNNYAKNKNIVKLGTLSLYRSI